MLIAAGHPRVIAEVEIWGRAVANPAKDPKVCKVRLSRWPEVGLKYWNRGMVPVALLNLIGVE